MGFFAVAGTILFFMQMVIGLWVYFCFPSLGWKMPVLLLPVLFSLLIQVTLAYTRTHYGLWESVAYFWAYSWAGWVFMAFFIVLAFAVLQALCTCFHLPTRTFLTQASMIVLAIVIIGSLIGGIKQPKIKHLDISISRAPEMKIAVISDAHLGVGVSVKRFQKALKRIAQEKPDAVFVLGDLFEYGAHREQYAQALAGLQTKYGTFGVLGNHEYYVGLDKSVDFYQKARIHLLDNKTYILPNGVELIGINDVHTSRLQPEQLDALLQTTHPTHPRILLSHQPLLTEVAAQHQIPLMLSGHTHRGQIFPFNFFVKLRYKYVYGWYTIAKNSKIYVTSGMFYWGMPLRFLTSSEIPLLHIQDHD